MLVDFRAVRKHLIVWVITCLKQMPITTNHAVALIRRISAFRSAHIVLSGQSRMLSPEF